MNNVTLARAGRLIAGSIVVASIHLVASQTDASAKPACQTMLQTAAQVNNIRNDVASANSAKVYCLANDIDMSSIANFQPLTNASQQFEGVLDGQGFVLKGLRMRTTAKANVGLFGTIVNIGDIDSSGNKTGVVRDLGLVDVDIVANGGTDAVLSVGAVTGALGNGTELINVYATGSISADAAGSAGSGNSGELRVGGLVGLFNRGVIQDSYSTVAVRGSQNGPYQTYAGGLVGYSGGTILRSFATGSVTATGAGVGVPYVGGLAGIHFNNPAATGITNSIVQSYATGPVNGDGVCTSVGAAGGLVGYLAIGGILQSYATGPVVATADCEVPGDTATAGGLVGLIQGPARVEQSFAVGRISGHAGDFYSGGLIGRQNDEGNMGPVIRSYWDKLTSDQSTSSGGAGRTTTQLQAALPAGFRANVWAITPGYSYPYLKAAGFDYRSTLSTVAFDGSAFAFGPLSQLDTSLYRETPSHADEASLAAVYTIVARGIGVTRNVASLADMKIDRFFWDDATQTAAWRGPVKTYATLGPLARLAGATPIGADNVIEELEARHVVAIRGSYTDGGTTRTHWMLATNYTVDAGGELDTLVALDPWTGTQVRIDPATKKVTAAGFPLQNFKVNAYRTISLIGAE